MRGWNLPDFQLCLESKTQLSLVKAQNYMKSELQKGSILVSRIPDIAGRKSGHFQIVAANLSIFGIKKHKMVDL